MSSLAQLKELSRVRLLLFFREPEAVFWVLIFPIVLSLVLGIAFQQKKLEKFRIGVLPGATSARTAAALAAAPALEVVPFEDAEAGWKKLRHGGVALLIEDGQPPTLHYDPTRPEAEVARFRADDALQRAAGRADPAELRTQAVEDTDSRYVNWLVPGLIGMNLMGTSLWGIAFGLVIARQRNLLKRFLVTPMRRDFFLFSFVVSRLATMVLEVTLITAFAYWVLSVPVRGSIFTFSFICLFGGLMFAGFALLLASRAKTIEGVSGLLNFAMLPMWLCSGTFFSYERFPEFLHPAIQALPLTALNDALRAVVLEGEGIAAVIPQLGVQAAWGSVCFFLALKIFRWF